MKDLPSSTTQSKFEYLPPPPEMRSSLADYTEETATARLKRKFIQQPLIPVGCALTAGALTYGMYQMKTGNSQMSQRMMRLRIMAQGFTVVALLFGVLHTANSKRLETTSSQR